MAHQIINQHGKHIQGDSNLEKIRFMINNGLDRTYVNGKKITVLMDTRKDKERTTQVHIDGI